MKEKVTGIGGVFFKAEDPKGLAEWYRDNLGVPVEAGQTYATFTAGGRGHAATNGPEENERSRAGKEQTVWSTFPADTSYFDPSDSSFMINFRVSDLDAMLEQLRAAGAEVDENIEEFDYGRFGWAMDPEGNRIELWEPIGPGF